MGIRTVLWTLFSPFSLFTLLYLVILQIVNLQYIDFTPIYRSFSNKVSHHHSNYGANEAADNVESRHSADHGRVAVEFENIENVLRDDSITYRAYQQLGMRKVV